MLHNVVIFNTCHRKQQENLFGAAAFTGIFFPSSPFFRSHLRSQIYARIFFFSHALVCVRKDGFIISQILGVIKIPRKVTSCCCCSCCYSFAREFGVTKVKELCVWEKYLQCLFSFLEIHDFFCETEKDECLWAGLAGLIFPARTKERNEGCLCQSRRKVIGSFSRVVEKRR